MGLFFGKSKPRKRKKPFIIINIVLILAMFLLLVGIIINDFEPIFLKLLYAIAGASWIIFGLEGYFQKEDKKVYIMEIGIGFLVMFMWL